MFGALFGCEGNMNIHQDEAAESEPSPTPTDATPCLDCVDDMLERARFEPPTTMGLRRLTPFEYDNTISSLLADELRPAASLSSPTGSTYGNAAELQSPNSTLVNAAETLALQIAETALVDGDRAESILGCQPTGPDDAACFETFVRRFGERALRRPLKDQEVAELVAFQARSVEEDDFYTGARLVMRVLLQHAEFLYRIEAGTPVPGHDDLYVLDGFEVASRMSYLLWGTAPDAQLLAAAKSGELSTSEGRRRHARRMIDGGEAERRKTLRRLSHFHALWLGYDNPQLGDIADDARAESDALLERVLFDERASWLDLFTWPRTWVTPALAEHYGFDAIDEPKWVDYGEERAGILSHATFLNAGTKVGITSPTMRGLHAYERLFCGRVAPPPPTIDIDEDQLNKCGTDGFCVSPAAAAGMACTTDEDCPEELGCKSEYSAFYLAPRPPDQQGCAGCHRQMDPIGLGLEHFDSMGRYRTHEEPKPLQDSDYEQPNCEIDGTGEAPGLGTFEGPDDLGRLLAADPSIERCAIRQWHQFAWGLPDLPSPSAPSVEAAHAQFGEHGGDLLATIVDVVADESFALRRAIPVAEESDTDGSEPLPVPPAPESDETPELMAGVDYGVVSLPVVSVDGRCTEFEAVDPVSFPTRVESYSNARQACRYGWNGDPAAPRMYGCCEVEDAEIIALLENGETGNIWDDDGTAFVVAPPVREKSSLMIKTEVNVHGATSETRWPDGPSPYDGNLERAAVQTPTGWTIEFASDLPISLDEDPRAYCEFRINDKDDATAGWAVAFGERLLREQTWGTCQFLGGE